MFTTSPPVFYLQRGVHDLNRNPVIFYLINNVEDIFGFLGWKVVKYDIKKMMENILRNLDQEKMLWVPL